MPPRGERRFTFVAGNESAVALERALDRLGRQRAQRGAQLDVGGAEPLDQDDGDLP